MSHTPGPWEVFGATHVWSRVAKANVASASAPRAGAHVGYFPPSLDDIDETAANAALIAAAPEMLDALKAFIEAERGLDMCEFQPELLDQCERAIAKAEGK